jgi:hypothetical protein
MRAVVEAGTVSITGTPAGVEFFHKEFLNDENVVEVEIENKMVFPKFLGNVSKMSYFFDSTALVDGLGILFCMPIIVKYERRPVYINSCSVCAACDISARVAMSYGSKLATRICVG